MDTTDQKMQPLIDRGKDLANYVEGMGLMEVMGKEGDTKLIWDKNNPDEVESARNQFEFFVTTKRYAAFSCDKDGNKSTQIRVFDPKAERIIFVPPLAGG